MGVEIDEVVLTCVPPRLHINLEIKRFPACDVACVAFDLCLVGSGNESLANTAEVVN